ncbi:septum site-determining protein Ssd [Nocardioides sp.]|uniref:septum site-determining protein Ssd n=1 Tax=Nocardioides sp. TaxID=35761 RepID=UPI003D0FE077
MTVPLIVTRDDVLLEELLRLSAAAGVVPELAADGQAALRSWSGPPVVLVGADLAAEVSGVDPPRRSGVHLVSWGDVAPEMFRIALRLGAENVAELPRAEGWIIEALSDLDEGGPGLILGVIGGSGGAGASTFACALAQVAARRAPAALIDLDPFGPGLDRMLGCESEAGIRWSGLVQSSGRLSARSLREAMPGRAGVGVLTWGSGQPGSLGVRGVREALAAAQRGHSSVVLDLPRLDDPWVDEVMARCDHLLVVVQPTLTGIASATRVCRRWAAGGPASLVVRRPGLPAHEIADVLDLPIAVELGRQRGLDEAIDLGVGPVRSFRGPLARAAATALDTVRSRTVT